MTYKVERSFPDYTRKEVLIVSAIVAVALGILAAAIWCKVTHSSKISAGWSIGLSSVALGLSLMYIIARWRGDPSCL